MTHRVVVVGGGFGGLPACRFLGRKPVEVTLLDRRNHHLFQPLLYQVATGILSGGQIAPPLRHVLRRHRNVRVELAEVTGFDLERRVVHTKRLFHDDECEVPYDSLIVAAGVTQSYFGHDELALFAPGMKTIDDAMELRRRIFGAFEMAEVATDPTEQQAWLTIVVVGAGPTGVELAGQIRELAVRSLRRDFRSFDPSSVRVLLLDAGKEPLATFGDRLSSRAAADLERLGVELRMGTRVTGIDADGVDVKTENGTDRIPAHVAVWAAGVEASPLAAALAEASGAEVDRSGRIATLPDLTLPGHPEVFAVGDMVTLNGLPGVAEVAMQGSLHAANTIVRRLDGKRDAKPFTYRDLGSVAAIARFRAICSVRGIRLSGFPAWVVWFFVHLTFLNGFGNRFSTLWRWFRAMVGRARPERVFSVGHTGGDLSAPAAVRAEIAPTPFPALEHTERSGTAEQP
jgi:NADH:quinone reductase (non-electrogenic)